MRRRIALWHPYVLMLFLDENKFNISGTCLAKSAFKEGYIE